MDVDDQCKCFKVYLIPSFWLALWFLSLGTWQASAVTVNWMPPLPSLLWWRKALETVKPFLFLPLSSCARCHSHCSAELTNTSYPQVIREPPRNPGKSKQCKKRQGHTRVGVDPEDRSNRLVFVRNKFWISKKKTAIPLKYLEETNFTLGQLVTLPRGNTETGHALGSSDMSLPHWWETTSQPYLIS